jgi:hypothetical protein
MEWTGLIVGFFAGTVFGLVVVSMLAAGKIADAESAAIFYKAQKEDAERELAAAHEAEKIHSTELKRIGKMGKRRGYISGANA